MTKPGTHNIEYYRGDFFDLTGRVATKNGDGTKTYWNLTGYTGKMQVRRGKLHTSMLIFEPTWDAGADLANGYFRFTETDENMTANTSIIKTPSDSPFYYDLFLVPAGGQARAWLSGTFSVLQNVTVL